MEMAEGIADAKEQFEKQGINLHNILISEKGSQVVVESVQATLKHLPHDELVGHLNTIQKCCKTNLTQRVLATDNGTYSVLVKLVQSSEKVNVLKTLTVVMDTNPGHLETQEVNLLNSLLLEHGVGEDPGQAVGDGDQGGGEGHLGTLLRIMMLCSQNSYQVSH